MYRIYRGVVLARRTLANVLYTIPLIHLWLLGSLGDKLLKISLNLLSIYLKARCNDKPINTVPLTLCIKVGNNLKDNVQFSIADQIIQ